MALFTLSKEKVTHLEAYFCINKSLQCKDNPNEDDLAHDPLIRGQRVRMKRSTFLNMRTCGMSLIVSW
jgi:hypothetical protein